eukprot:CAMPEP_0194356220 /NCGR_PEP_ID=MMETSP0174-20130528/3944_1 /TAXON_ID=216777 /ORGANISM="Proboscia alata, Strain PI-D3" /LENGTH=842 /DNA_ID=CAMNT_0039125747 /DNA_START=577 /DNA_END=3106 /DNA_ORIENTATION=-
MKKSNTTLTKSINNPKENGVSNSSSAQFPPFDSSNANSSSGMSSDLFGGDLFGDELIDMYTSAVSADDSSDMGILGTDVTNDESTVTNSSKASNATMNISPNASDGANDLDGLGTFQPSASFNDLTNLLPPNEDVVTSPSPAPSHASQPVSVIIVQPTSTTLKAPEHSNRILSSSNAPVATQEPKTKKRMASSIESTAAKVTEAAAAAAAAVDNAAKKAAALRVANVNASVATATLAASSGKAQKIASSMPARRSARSATLNAVNTKTASNFVPLVSGSVSVKSESQQIQNNDRSKLMKACENSTDANCLPNPLDADSAHNGTKTRSQIHACPQVIARDIATHRAPTHVLSKPVQLPTRGITLPPGVTLKSGIPCSALPDIVPSHLRGPVAIHTKIDHPVAIGLFPHQLRRPDVIGPGVTAQQKAPEMAASFITESRNFDTSPGVYPINTGPVDITSAHVAALTSASWEAGLPTLSSYPTLGTLSTSGSSASMTDSSSSAAIAAANAAKRRRLHLTPDERARQNRDRNREHARNTRLRKKAYVEELKRTLTEMVAQRDSAELDRRHVAQREMEQREVRFRVMEEFLKLRGSNEPNMQRWSAIFESCFTFTLPLTNFRKVVKHNNASQPILTHKYEQLLRGAQEVMTDASYLAAALEMIGKGTLPWANNAMTGNKVFISYDCDSSRFLMDDCIGVMDWSAITVGAVNQGATAEIVWKGSLRATFSPSTNKLTSAEIIFDTKSFSEQLQGSCVRSTTIQPIQQDIQVSSNAFDIAHVVKAMGSDTHATAQAAAAAADAVLDSLDIPHFDVSHIVNSLVRRNNKNLIQLHVPKNLYLPPRLILKV